MHYIGIDPLASSTSFQLLEQLTTACWRESSGGLMMIYPQNLLCIYHQTQKDVVGCREWHQWYNLSSPASPHLQCIAHASPYH